MTELDVLSQHLGHYKTMANANHYFECPSCHHHNNKLNINDQISSKFQSSIGSLNFNNYKKFIANNFMIKKMP